MRRTCRTHIKTLESVLNCMTMFMIQLGSNSLIFVGTCIIRYLQCACAPSSKSKNWNWYPDQLAKGSMTRNEELAVDLWQQDSKVQVLHRYSEVRMISHDSLIDQYWFGGRHELHRPVCEAGKLYGMIWNDPCHVFPLCLRASCPERDAQGGEMLRATKPTMQQFTTNKLPIVTVTVTLPRSRHSVKCSS